MKKKLLASALAVAFGLSGVALANDTDQRTKQKTEDGNNTSTTTSTSTSTDASIKQKSDYNNDKSTNKQSGAATASAARSVALNNGSAGQFTNAFNVSKSDRHQQPEWLCDGQHGA